jgi:pyruvate dehydrogenase E1 component
MPRHPESLGTDGFGRSDTREALREFFEVDFRHITLAALGALARDGEIKPETVRRAMKKMDVNPDKPNPLNA